MKSLLCLCCLLAVSSLAWAETKAKATEKKVEVTASDKSSDSKPKRDASLLAGNYHGPSYKYLPPGAGGLSTYDSYAGSHHGLASSSGGHSAGFGGGYSSGFGSGGYSGPSVSHHSSGHHGGSSSGLGYASSGHHGGSSSGLGYASSGLAGGYSGHSSGHHSSGHFGGGSSGAGSSSGGLGYASSGHYSGHGLSHHSGAGGIKGGSHGFSSGPSYTVSSLGHGGYSGGGPSYTAGHGGFGSSGSAVSSGHGFKTHSVAVPSYALSSSHGGSSGPSFGLSSGHGGSSGPSFGLSSGHGGSSGPSFGVSSGHGGSSAGSAGGYHYSKGSSGSFPSSSSSSGFGGASHGVHSTDHADDFNHVHNGDLEHHYNVASGGVHSAGFGGSHGAPSSSSSFGQQGGYSYESPVQQHALPASSYGVPLTTVGDAYSTNYHAQQQGAVQELGPVYAAGHKGLGHFGFSASKPQVLHTSISGSSFKQPSYSKAPFKPSAFLGSKYEGSSQNEAPSQQYLPPSGGAGADGLGYDYSIPSAGSVTYQETQYQTNVEQQATPIHEPEATYLPANHNNEASYNEISSAPSGSYLPPGQSYNGPYAN